MKPSHIRPLDPSRLGDEVAHMLRRAIISGELESGTHLVESALSERFGVSRAPIRDALKELQSEGLVESRRRGVHVKPLNEKDVWELHHLRQTLEVAALELAVRDFDVEDVAALGRHVERMESAAAAGRSEDLAEADMLFHQTLCERVGHSRLLRAWQSFSETFRVILEMTDAANTDLEGTAADHRRILDAIERRDLERARAELVGSLASGQALFEHHLEARARSQAGRAEGGRAG
jgi:GntR family transcriptional regulator of gluconate operon